VLGTSGGRDIFIMIDNRFEPFGDQRARQALNYAVDKQAILDAFFQGRGTILAGIANGFWENEDLDPYPYDPDRALELFAELGYTPGPDGKLQKDGETISLTMHTSDGRYMKDKEVAQAVAADLNELGLDVTVEPLEWSVLSSKAYAGELAPLTLRGLGGFFNAVGEMRWVDPAPQYSEELDREIRWQSEEFEDLYADMRAEMDTERRKEMADELQAMALEGAPWIFLYKQYDFYGINDRIKNWEPRPDEFVLLYGNVEVEGDR
jgi:peptide/nickel transport system substrate-binding protein